MEFKRVKEWVETASAFHGFVVLLGGVVIGRTAWLLELPRWAIFIGALLGIVIVFLALLYTRNDPEKSWIYKTLVIVITIGALSAIDAKVSGWMSKVLFNPEQQVRKWLDELHYINVPVIPPPEGQRFRFEVKNVKENRNFAIYQDSANADTILIFSLVETQYFFNTLPANERDKVWLDMGLALIRSDIKISPVARFGPLQVVNWFPFGPEITRQQFFTEVRRFNLALETINVLVERKTLVKDPNSERQP